MTRGRLASSRRIRVGDNSGVGVSTTRPVAGLLGSSRRIRVWGAGGVIDCTATAYDDFLRTIADSLTDGWGTAGLGLWTRDVVAGAPAYSGVNGTSAKAAWAAGSPATGRYVTQALPDATYTTPVEFVMDTTRTQLANSALDFYLIAAGHDAALDDYIRCQSDWAGITIQVETGGQSLGDTASLLARGLTTGQPQRTRWRIESTAMRAKMWAIADPEPASWDVVLTYPAGTLTGLFASAHVRANLWCHTTGPTYLDRITVGCDTGGGGIVVSLANWLYQTWGYDAVSSPTPTNGGAPTVPLSSGASLASRVVCGYSTLSGTYYGQVSDCIYIQADIGDVTIAIDYRVSAYEANDWGGIVPWELRATPWYTGSATVSDDGFDGTTLASGTIDTTGATGAVTVTGTLTVSVPASGQVTLGVAVPSFHTVLDAALGAHVAVFEVCTLGIDSIRII